MAVTRTVVLLTLLALAAPAADLVWLPEHFRPDPFGEIVARDRTGTLRKSRLTLARAARGGYFSAHLMLKVDRAGSYELSINTSDRAGKLSIDLYREWFHFTEFDRQYYPDALIPVDTPFQSSVPDPQNKVPKQSAVAFWADVWIPADTKPGTYTLRASARLAGGRPVSSVVELEVTELVVPQEDAITMDHNSYGSSFLAEQFPKLAAEYGNRFAESEDFISLIHSYHRIFHVHRGTYHQLGYGHGGKVGPEFAPALTGAGTRRRVASWTLFDKHYGPLLDGTAFSRTRRGARPIPFVYLPINPDWPASFLNWGEPGYQAEFTNVVREMERHFREKGWVNTRFEMYFNHKKRYKAYPWDGDEVRFPEDNQYLKEYSRLLKAAVPPDSPVKFLFRADVSWSMEQQFRDLAGIVNMWVCSSSILGWLRDAPAMLRSRGDVVWHYSGPPPVTQPAVAITKMPLRTWMWRLDGYVHWLAVNPGGDPWFRFDGGGTTLVYSGEQFGIRAPIPSARLKFQRNCLQDLALLTSLRKNRAEVARLFNNTTPDQWWSARPKIADSPAREMTNPDIEEASQENDLRLTRADPEAWWRVRQMIFTR